MFILFIVSFILKGAPAPSFYLGTPMGGPYIPPTGCKADFANGWLYFLKLVLGDCCSDELKQPL